MTRAIDHFQGSAYRHDGVLFDRGRALYDGSDDPNAVNWPIAFGGTRNSYGETVTVASGLVEVVENVATMWLYGPEAAELAALIVADDEDNPGDGVREKLINDMRRLVQGNTVADDDGTVLSFKITPSMSTLGHRVHVEVYAIRGTNA